MPVFFDSDREIAGQDTAEECITIGLVNNMGDEALKSTERQYISLLNSASDGMLVRLSFYTLPGVTRNRSIGGHIRSVYANIDDLWESTADGLIVTGREPMAKSLPEEPYWGSFTRLLAWSEENASSTIWSCLSAHAAVLHMDGIDRVRRDDKLFGVFPCVRVTDHFLTAAIPSTFRLPHSRWNSLQESQLTESGYTVLTRGNDTGVDTFIKQEKKLFLFFQGHPEYEFDTLLREYRRDVGRFFRDETTFYPSLPHNYFSEAKVAVLSEFQEKAMMHRSSKLFLEILNVLAMGSVDNTWQAGAASMYRSWLQYLCAQKKKRLRSTAVHVMTDLAPVS
jgi:homoserine O-succinyltransferase